MSEQPVTYTITAAQRRHTAILRRLTPLGWQAQRMAMEISYVDPARAPSFALRALDNLIEDASRVREAIAQEIDA